MGADPNLGTEKGFTPIYVAAEKNHNDIVKMLINNKANVNQANERGFTPLYVAV